MVTSITWDTLLVWLLFAVAVFFLLKPMLPLFRKKKARSAPSGDCTKCHP